MQEFVFLVPGSLGARTGGSIYDRRMVDGLSRLGWWIDVRPLHGAFPRPSDDVVREIARMMTLIQSGSTVVVDGLVFGALAEVVEREAERLRFVAIVHLPLALEVGLDRETAARLEAGGRRALAAARLVIV